MTPQPTYNVTITVPGASAPVTIFSETNCASVQDIPADATTGRPAHKRITKGSDVWEIDFAPGMVTKVTTVTG